MSIFKCKHPADMLSVEKSETREQRNNDFDLVTYHLYCCSCGQKVKISYAALRGGVAGFMGIGSPLAGRPTRSATSTGVLGAERPGKD